jgi:hypothetical protein
MSVDVVYDVPIGAGTQRQVTQTSFSENIDVMAARMSGAPVISDQFIQSASPMAELSSVDIGGFLTNFGTVGGQIANGSTVIVPYHKRVSGGTFQGGSSNLIVSGVVNCPVQYVPLSVSCPALGSPVANGQLHFLSGDGETQPWAVAANQALANQAFVACYGLGPIFLNGVQVPRHIGFTVNFGVGLSDKKHYDGAPYPSDIFMEQFDPSIEFNQEDFDFLAGIAGGGAITTLVCYLRKRASGGTYIANGTAAHIKFSFTSGFLSSQQVSASETKNGTQGVRCLGRTLLVGNGVALT